MRVGSVSIDLLGVALVPVILVTSPSGLNGTAKVRVFGGVAGSKAETVGRVTFAVAPVVEDKPVYAEATSSHGKVFGGFTDLAAWIAEYLKVESAVLDGEIACVDDDERPVFRDLLFRRRQCVFIAFDLLYLNGKDPRTGLIERKVALKKLLRSKRSRILYLDHVEGDGRLLFEQIVKMDLEGIVCKRKD